MSQQNLIEIIIEERDLVEIKAAIETLRLKLMPHLKTLTGQDRQELPKMGDKTLAFVEKALEYGTQYKDLIPSFLDLEAMKKDVKAVESLRELVYSLNPIVDALNDSLTLSGSEAYQAALIFYGNVKNAAKAKTKNANSILEDLSRRFPGGGGKKKSNGE